MTVRLIEKHDCDKNRNYECSKKNIRLASFPVSDSESLRVKLDKNPISLVS